MRAGHLEVTCRGPVESALQYASVYGVEVSGYVHSEGGLVALFVPSDYEDDVLRWYGSSSDVRAPGAVVSVVRVLAVQRAWPYEQARAERMTWSDELARA